MSSSILGDVLQLQVQVQDGSEWTVALRDLTWPMLPVTIPVYVGLVQYIPRLCDLLRPSFQTGLGRFQVHSERMGCPVLCGPSNAILLFCSSPPCLLPVPCVLRYFQGQPSQGASLSAFSQLSVPVVATFIRQKGNHQQQSHALKHCIHIFKSLYACCCCRSPRLNGSAGCYIGYGRCCNGPQPGVR